jgi:hypothetical protein
MTGRAAARYRTHRAPSARGNRSGSARGWVSTPIRAPTRARPETLKPGMTVATFTSQPSAVDAACLTCVCRRRVAFRSRWDSTVGTAQGAATRTNAGNGDQPAAGPRDRCGRLGFRGRLPGSVCARMPGPTAGIGVVVAPRGRAASVVCLERCWAANRPGSSVGIPRGPGRFVSSVAGPRPGQ